MTPESFLGRGYTGAGLRKIAANTILVIAGVCLVIMPVMALNGLARATCIMALILAIPSLRDLLRSLNQADTTMAYITLDDSGITLRTGPDSPGFVISSERKKPNLIDWARVLSVEPTAKGVFRVTISPPGRRICRINGALRSETGAAVGQRLMEVLTQKRAESGQPVPAFLLRHEPAPEPAPPERPPFAPFGKTIEDALQTPFFTWFHLVETERETGPVEDDYTFRPSAPPFHALVSLKLKTEHGFIRQACLTILRRFIDDPGAYPHAADIAKSFILDGIGPSDPAAQAIAAEIFAYRPAGAQAVVLSRAMPGQDEASGKSPEYQVYADERTACAHPFLAAQLDLANHDDSDDACLTIGIRPVGIRP